MMIFAMIFSLGDVCEIRFCPFLSSFLTRFSHLIESAVKKIPKPPSLRTGRAKWAALLSKCSALWSTRTRRCPPSFCTASPSCVAPMIVQCSCQWDSHGNTFKNVKRRYTEHIYSHIYTITVSLQLAIHFINQPFTRKWNTSEWDLCDSANINVSAVHRSVAAGKKEMSQMKRSQTVQLGMLCWLLGLSSPGVVWYSFLKR